MRFLRIPVKTATQVNDERVIGESMSRIATRTHQILWKGIGRVLSIMLLATLVACMSFPQPALAYGDLLEEPIQIDAGQSIRIGRLGDSTTIGSSWWFINYSCATNDTVFRVRYYDSDGNVTSDEVSSSISFGATSNRCAGEPLEIEVYYGSVTVTSLYAWTLPSLESYENGGQIAYPLAFKDSEVVIGVGESITPEVVDDIPNVISNYSENKYRYRYDIDDGLSYVSVYEGGRIEGDAVGEAVVSVSSGGFTARLKVIVTDHPIPKENPDYALSSVNLTLNGSSRDVLTEVFTVDAAKKDTTFGLTATLKNPDVTPRGFVLYQDGGTVCTTIAKAGEDGDFGSIKYSKLKVGQPVYISVSDGKGNVVYTKQLCITVKNSNDDRVPNSFEWGGKGITFTMTGGPFNGLKITVPASKSPIMAMISEDGKVRLGVNLDLTKIADDWEFDWTEGFFDTKSLRKYLDDIKEPGYKPDGKFKVNTVMYLEGNLTSGTYTGVGIIKISLDASQETQHFILGIPVVTQISFGVGGELEGRVTVVTDGRSAYLQNAGKTIGLSGDAELYGGLGAAYTFSGGVYGSLSPHGKWVLVPRASAGLERLWIEGEAGLKLLVLGKDLKFPLLEGTFDAYYRDTQSLGGGGGALMAALDTTGAGDDAASLSRAYAAQTSAWGSGAGGSLQSAIYPDASVRVVPAEDGAIMAFLSDDASRGADNRSLLVWSRYDAASGTWSQPQPVWQDGTADFSPSLAADGQGGAYVAWSNARSAVPDGMSLQDEAALLDVAYAHITADGIVEGTQFVTNDDSLYEMSPAVGAADGMPVVAWATTPLAQVLGTSGFHDVCLAVPAGDGWDVSTVAQTGDVVTSLSAGSYGGAAVAWSTDADGALDTLGDSRAYVAAANGEQEMLGEAAWLPTFTQLDGADAIAWWQDGDLVYATASGDASGTAFEGMPLAAYSLDGDLAGDAVLTYVRTGESTAELVGRRLTAGEWSDVVLFADDDDSVMQWGAVLAGGEPLAAFTTLPADGSDEAGAILWSMSGNQMASLAIDDVDYSPDVANGEGLGATVYVTNTSPVPLESVELSLGGDASTTQAFDVPIAPGETAELEYSPVVDAVEETPTLELVASTGGFDDVVEIELRTPRLALHADHLIVDGTERAAVTVGNVGLSQTAAGSVVFYSLETDGVLATVDLPSLAPEETFECSYDSAGGLFKDEGLQTIGVRIETPDGSADPLLAFDIVPVFDEDWDDSFDADAPSVVEEWPFVDVKAPDESGKGGTAHWEDINWMYYSGISQGWDTKSGRQYRPLNNVARADMAAFLYRLAGSPEYTPTAADKAYFSDVNSKTPHAKEIWWMASTGISKGWDMRDGTHQFRPYANVARCDMAAFLYRLAGSPEFEPSDADKGYFSDVNSRTAHATEVWWMASMEISAGWTMRDGTHQFRPLNNVARADMAAFLHRMSNKGLVRKYS